MSATATAFIYTLADPRDPNRIRYVGKTNNPGSRLASHLRHRTPRSERTRKSMWIRSLEKAGITPLMVILDEAPHDEAAEWQELERFYIAYLRFLGCDLTNLSIGGHGGDSLSEETKAKLKDLRNTPEFKAAVSARHTGMKFTPEQRARCSASKKGIAKTPEWRASLSRSKMGKPFTAEHRAALSKARIGKKRGPHSPETIAKIRASRMRAEALRR